jgi:hypothetical protein
LAENQIGVNEIERWRTATETRFIAEAWAAAVVSVNRPTTDRFAWIHRRFQNAWLLGVWPAVEVQLSEQAPAEVLALYLALGWTQATTTWQWPATERWISLLDSGPPDDWLPRSQWHLCWLLYNRADQAHHQGLQKALDEGLNDETRPGIAAALRELFCEPGE